MTDTTPTPQNEVSCNDGIIQFDIHTSVDTGEAARLSALGKNFLESCMASCILIDLHQSTEFSSSARKIWVEFLKNDRIKRAALLGGNVFVKTVATFVIAATGEKNIQFFDTKERALAWLKEDCSSNA